MPAIAAYLRFLENGRGTAWSTRTLRNLANARNYGGSDGVRLEFQAKSWLLTHYMLSSDDKRKRLNRYLTQVDRGVSPPTAFENAFGMKMSDIDEVMWRYGRRGTEVLRVALPSLPSARVKFRTMPRAAGEFVMVDAALKSCPSRQTGESLLKKVAELAARFPKDVAARLALSRAQIDWGNPQDALPALNAVLQEDDANPEALYLLGMANLRLAERSEGDARRSKLEAARSQPARTQPGPSISGSGLWRLQGRGGRRGPTRRRDAEGGHFGVAHGARSGHAGTLGGARLRLCGACERGA
jgi:hypothetical protein